MKYFDTAKFITFEGGEGSGKSTQSKMLYEYLLSQNIKVIHTREVGGTEPAEKMRDILIYSDLLPVSELMLVMSARYEHINKVIVPAIRNGVSVICDRFVDSSACYQSSESGLTLEDIYDLHDKLMTVNNFSNKDFNNSFKNAILPDNTFFMDLEPKICLERIKSRNDEKNKVWDKDMALHQKVYNDFISISKMFKDRFILVQCENKSLDEIHQNIKEKIEILG